HTVKCIAAAGTGLGGIGTANHDKRCNAGSKATEGIHNDCQPVHIDTGQAGSLTVTAERIDFTAQIGFVHDHPTEDDKSGKDNDRDGDDSQVALANYGKGFRHTGDGIAAGDKVRHTFQNQHGAQRHDNGHDVQLDRHQTVDGTHYTANDDGGNDCHRNGQAGIDHHIAHQHTINSHLTTDRQVHTAADHDHGNTHNHNAEHGELPHNVDDVFGRQEVG